jgi:hypothetical protein
LALPDLISEEELRQYFLDLTCIQKVSRPKLGVGDKSVRRQGVYLVPMLELGSFCLAGPGKPVSNPMSFRPELSSARACYLRFFGNSEFGFAAAIWAGRTQDDSHILTAISCPGGQEQPKPQDRGSKTG